MAAIIHKKHTCTLDSNVGQPMSWDEFKQIGLHSGTFSLRDIGLGIVTGLGIGGAIGLILPSAGLWVAIGGAVVGGVLGILPSVVKNQAMAYDRYLTQYQQIGEHAAAERSKSLILTNGVTQLPSMEGINVARLKKERQEETIVGSHLTQRM